MPKSDCARGLKDGFDKFHEGGIGKGERNERNGDEEVHPELQAREFFVNELEFFRHDAFEAFETLLHDFEAFFKNFSRHKLLLQLFLERNMQKLFLFEDSFFGALLHVVDRGLQRLGYYFRVLSAAQRLFEHVESFAGKV